MLKRRPFTLHPFLFAVHPIILLYSKNLQEVSPVDLLRPVVAALVATLLLFLVLRFFFRDGQKAALAVTVAILLFYLYGPFFLKIVHGIAIGDTVVGRHRTLFPIWALIFLIAVIITKRSRAKTEGATSFLNLIGIGLVSLVIISTVSGTLKLRAESGIRSWKEVVAEQCALESKALHPKQPMRDIYYIVLDGYARDDVLRDFYGYDNSAFTKGLEKRGFYVAYQSQSSYTPTYPSLSTSLNMNYLDVLRKPTGVTSNNKALLESMIRNNKVSRLLQNVGYTFVFFSSGWQVTYRNPNADISYPRGEINLSEFERALLLNSALHAFVSGSHRRHVLYALDAVETAPDVKGPAFTFVHIICPHEPASFNANGNIPKPARLVKGKLPASESKRLYLGQVQFINRRIEKVLDAILSKPGPKPIIILQGDHGPRQGMALQPPDHLSPEAQKTALEKMRFGMLNAYYLPDGGDRLLYQTINPANSFRIMFNYYFGADYKLLEDRKVNWKESFL